MYADLEPDQDDQDFTDMWLDFMLQRRNILREGNFFIQFLLDAGLEINALNKYGTTMLSCAASCGNMEIVEFLVFPQGRCEVFPG